MSYQALYRKFRPTTFELVVGQEHIVKTLKNQLKTGRVSHAYLFCGTRGTGKTSTAKIFARAINCLSPVEGEPCNECTMCQAIYEGRSLNVVEIDAASNNGVDNIREIREEVKYPPTEGKYKVYIIDEVHMLSQGAFNALLKTLEEPPKHVLFILATTDPQKVPITILSRCQRFDFHRISSVEIAKTLQGFLKEEKTIVEEKALQYIARLADGSMRDALSILDQCMAFYYQEEITLEKVLDVIGAVDNRLFFEMTEAIQKKDASKALELIEDMMMQGRDIAQFVSEWIGHLRNLLVILSLPEAERVLDVSEETVAELQKQSRSFTSEELMYLIRTISELSSDLKYASNERILLEVQLLKLCSPVVEESYEGLSARIYELERKLQNGQISVSSAPVSTDNYQASSSQKKKELPKALPEEMKVAIEKWDSLKTEFDAGTKGILSAVELGYMENDSLTLICNNEAVEGILKNKLDKIQEKLEDKLQKKFSLKTITKAKYQEWKKSMYGTEQRKEEDLEFESLMKNWLPDAELE